MLIISTQEFKGNPNKYLRMAGDGEEIILQSKENGSFAITPVMQEVVTIPDSYILEPDDDLKRAITGEQLMERLTPRIEKLFDK